jgi:hypothetical protein
VEGVTGAARLPLHAHLAEVRWQETLPPHYSTSHLWT